MYEEYTAMEDAFRYHHPGDYPPRCVVIGFSFTFLTRDNGINSGNRFIKILSRLDLNE